MVLDKEDDDGGGDCSNDDNETLVGLILTGLVFVLAAVVVDVVDVVTILSLLLLVLFETMALSMVALRWNVRLADDDGGAVVVVEDTEMTVVGGNAIIETASCVPVCVFLLPGWALPLPLPLLVVVVVATRSSEIGRAHV